MTKDETWKAIKNERREDDWRQPEIVGFLAGMRAAAKIAGNAGCYPHSMTAGMIADDINEEADALEGK